MENYSFWCVGFRVDQLAGTAAPAQAQCKANTVCGGGCKEKLEGDTHLEPVTHSLPADYVQRQTELNRKSKEDPAKSVAPAHRLGATRATNLHGLHWIIHGARAGG